MDRFAHPIHAVQSIATTSPPRTAAFLLFAAAFLLFAATPAAAADLDWDAVADVQTVHVLTTDEDGDARVTKIWLVVLDGRGYIRTSRRTTWGKNVARDPDITLRIGETDYPVRATFIVDEAERARIVAAFEEKYGSNPILNFLRGGDPPIMRLEAR
jgi:hypothetical protein